MALNRVRIPLSGRDIPINLPKAWEVIARLRPSPLPRLNDISQALKQSLDNPIGCPALSSFGLSNKRIVIVVDDKTRPTPSYLFFSSVLKYLFNHGVRKEDLFLLPALGVHGEMTQGDMEKKLGKENLSSLRWINHNSKDINEHAKLGSTKRGTPVYLNKHIMTADLIICIGLIEPHPLLGFGGGLKMILPGLAYHETINRNHMQGITPTKYNHIGSHDSPMREDLEEGVGLLKKEIFIIDAVLNQDLEVCRFVSGDAIKAHREGVKTVEEINAKRITEKADVAIVASNPMNADLRQGIKCIANIEQSVKADGLILALLECRHGIGDIAIPPKPLFFNYKTGRFIFKLLGNKGSFYFLDKLKKKGVEEKFLSHFSMQIARKNRIFIFSNNLPIGTDRRLGLFRQFDNLDQMLKEAAGALPRKAKVYIYPYGGVTYPVLEGVPH